MQKAGSKGGITTRKAGLPGEQSRKPMLFPAVEPSVLRPTVSRKVAGLLSNWSPAASVPGILQAGLHCKIFVRSEGAAAKFGLLRMPGLGLPEVGLSSPVGLSCRSLLFPASQDPDGRAMEGLPHLELCLWLGLVSMEMAA